MYFDIDAAEWAKAVSQVRGVYQRKTWWRIAHEDRYWKPAFLAAFIEKINELLLDSPHEAFSMSRDLPLMAERLRVEDCPQGELGKRSLVVWAWSVRGSACRVVGALEEAERAFMEAYTRANGVQPWAAAEACRRFAAMLMHQRNPRALDLIDRALTLYEGLRIDQAKTLVLRGTALRQLWNDSSQAILNYAQAQDLIGPPTTAKEFKIWEAAAHNAAIALVKDEASSKETILEALKLFQVSRRKLNKNAGYRRQLMTWLEGLLYARLGSLAKAERRLLATWRWLLRNKFLHLAVVVALDLVAILRKAGEGQQAQRTIDTTRQALNILGSQDLLIYLERWVAAEIASQTEIRDEIVAEVGRLNFVR